MLIWQADFYRHGELWELLICNPSRSFEYTATCPQSQANSTWIATQLQQASKGNLPDVMQVFRPQSLGLIQQAATSLSISVEPTRRTSTLKKWLQEKQYSIAVDQPPPTPLPENLWGEQWRFATIEAGEITDVFAERPIPILHMPEAILPINLGLASTQPISGVVIYGGRQSMRLARWLQETHPVSLNYIPGEPDGLVLEAGLVDRWVITTFDDGEVSAAARVYQQRLQETQGLHFLLVQPDDSGMTYSGFWLLQKED